MSVTVLLKAVAKDTTGVETSLRVIGSREPPGKMSIQVSVTGAASVRIQAKIAREAPWVDVGPAYSASALAYIEPVQFLRAVTSGMDASSVVTVWAVWAW
ncbi:MAG: hypothetical protein ACREV5_18155 [Steroidobacter sp.]